MLNYSLLYLFGYDISKEDLMNFRQLGYKTPGHPEYGHTPGIETTTGPLGQGIANAVGMAVAEAHLAATFNRDGFPVVDHYTYVLCGDGCLEEGISYEACSFAGTHKLGKLILFYDDNDITIEGDTDITFKEDVAMRFKAQGWQVLKVDDANDLDLLRRTQELERQKGVLCGFVLIVLGIASSALSRTTGGTDVQDFLSGILMGLSVAEILVGIWAAGKKLLKQ